MSINCSFFIMTKKIVHRRNYFSKHGGYCVSKEWVDSLEDDFLEMVRSDGKSIITRKVEWLKGNCDVVQYPGFEEQYLIKVIDED